MEEKKIKKTEKEIFGIYYNPSRALSYHKPLIYSVGSRSIGKSTGWGIKLLLDYLNHGKKWIYTRRTQDELMLTCRTWFDNPVSILSSAGYEIKNFTYEGGNYFIDGKIAGYAIPLSMEQKYKSSNFSDVWYCVFDEFINRKGQYLGGRGSMYEVDCVESLFQTIDRGVGRPSRDELTFVHLGNAASFYNPHFIAHEIDRYLRSDTKYLSPKNEPYVVELTRETEATKEIKKSNAYAISRKRTRDYAFDNITFDSKSEFICKTETRGLEQLFNIIFDGNTYGIYVNQKKGIIYVSHRPCYTNINIAATTEDHKPNYLMVTRWSKHPYTKLLNQSYEHGLIRFETAKCKYAIDNYMLYLL